VRRILLLCALMAVSLGLKAMPPSEAVVKAALVANLANYAEWPDALWSVKHTLICVAGRGPVVEALNALDSQTIRGRRIGISSRSRPGDAKDCQILFLGDGPGRNQGEWLLDWTQSLGSLPVLSVCETDEVVSQGCMVGLLREGTQVAFDVNLTALRRANLRLSAHLLRLARIVYGKPDHAAP